MVEANFAGHFGRFWKLCALGLRNILSRDSRSRFYALDMARHAAGRQRWQPRKMAVMATYSVQRGTEGFSSSFRVCDTRGVSVGSCNQFLIELSQRDCSVYTQRAYAIALAHFFNWLHHPGRNPDHVNRQTVGSYIAEFARGGKQGAVTSSRTDKARQPRTINHRISVLSSYFDYCIRCDTEDGRGPWNGRVNPASGNPLADAPRHGMIGRDLPQHRAHRDGFRRRVPRVVPQRLDPSEIRILIDTASSWRDKAILTLLSRAGQRIGDWSILAGRHGVLGMTLDDIDRKRRTITVRLKGARDEHRVPITDDFWPLLDEYLSTERRAPRDLNALWVAARKGKGKPLCYATFESSLRYIARKAGVTVHPHLFRHTLAQGVLDTTGNIKVAQEILGHAHLSTTADLYMHVDQQAMVTALAAVKTGAERSTTQRTWPTRKAAQYAFDYDDQTVAELERTIEQASRLKSVEEES
jgi:site-specific recombinase XerD